MDRRGFLKFMGVSAAATSASTVLAGIPEVAPKIELLEPKKVITTVSDEVTLFKSVISIQMRKDENLMFHDSFGQGVHPQLGRNEVTGKVSVYPSGEQMVELMSNNMHIHRVAFDVPELAGKLFLVSSFDLSSSLGDHSVVEFDVVEIHNNGSVKMS